MGREPGLSWWRPVTLSLQTLEEIAELQEDIRHLEEDLRRKLQNLKLCHTRLESRTYRPSVELCRDQVRGYPRGALAPAKASSRSPLPPPAHIPGQQWEAGVLMEGSIQAHRLTWASQCTRLPLGTVRPH